MNTAPDKSSAGRPARGRNRARNRACQCCGKTVMFCWTCRCGFAICQKCMLENLWGMSCNSITWYCPDCGGLNGFGNQ
ncbi:hypothetical protein HNR65_000005 [Desulfosalsimonas propionicica]|uniref:Uncharacterized protein n=1 Tax=Desulfosalsimonas propionicica TaxID=332175 RepID=A0A7W0C5X3_9BACT|nr:hypothetical protein [Desulfosalsimonas propionicica]MBA2879698.1 hypothetical protein [Desulfosalsimonas propionicica]